MMKIRLTFTLLIVLFLILIPFTAMQFSNEINWELSDFLIAAVLLLSLGIIINLILIKVKNKQAKMFLVLSATILLILTFFELAVGLFSSVLSGN